jgi:hypothetical protein
VDNRGGAIEREGPVGEVRQGVDHATEDAGVEAHDVEATGDGAELNNPRHDHPEDAFECERVPLRVSGRTNEPFQNFPC